MRINYISYFFKESLKNIYRNSSITLMSLFLITISLFIIGLMLSINHTIVAYMGNLNNKPNMIFFIKNNASLSDKEKFLSELKHSPLIKKAEFVDKNTVKSQIKDQTILELTKLYGDDIIPEGFFVYTHFNITKQQFEQLYNQLKNNPIIESSYYEGKMIYLFSYFKKIIFFIFLIFSILVILIVGNAIRLSIFSKEDEIYLKKLIGATHYFILAPFIIEGFVKGLIGGILTDIIFLILSLIKGWIIPMEFTNMIHFITIKEAIIIPLLGGVFGWFGAIISSIIYVKH